MGGIVLAADYHMHIENGSPEPAYLRLYAEAARRAGLSDYGISEHLHNLDRGPSLLGRPLPEGIPLLGWSTPAYIEAVKASGAKAGVEADYIPETENELRDYLESNPYDYCIGSVHWLEGWVFDWKSEAWEGMSVEDVWRSYFKTAIQAVSTGMFDIFGHPDVIKVFGIKPGPAFDEELGGWYKALAEAAAGSDTCLEVSSAGLRKPVGEYYPGKGLLKAAFEAGCHISLASDAHFPEHVAYGFADLVEYAKSAGFAWAATFGERKRSLIKL